LPEGRLAPTVFCPRILVLAWSGLGRISNLTVLTGARQDNLQILYRAGLQTANSACLHLETDQQSPKSQEIQGLALDEMEVAELTLRWT
jgi:hypothetical protein